jgi:glycerol 3-phosphatase-2
MTDQPGQAGQPVSPRSSPQGCTEPLASAYDVALLDLDGVVYLGGVAIPGAPEALAKAAASGMRLAFVTNNAARTPSAIAAHLTSLGVTASASEVVTSAQAAARLLAERLPAGAPVLVVGGMGLRAAVRERGFRPVTVASDRPAAVVQGYSPDISYSLLAEAALAVRAGAWFVASNGDLTLPSPRGRLPGNGSLAQVVASAAGHQPVFAGKPEPPLHAEAVARTAAVHPLIVGDRLNTDIEGAVRARVDSLLVLTGVSDPSDAVCAPAHQRPVYLAEDLGGLLTPHPPVSYVSERYRCGGWRAHVDPDGSAVLDGQGEPIDGLRALCAAAWSAPGLDPGSVRSALAPLGW